MFPNREKIKFPSGCFCSGYVITLFCALFLLSVIAAGQELTASLDVRLIRDAAASPVYPQTESAQQNHRLQAQHFLKNSSFDYALKSYQAALRSNPDDTRLIGEYQALQKAIQQKTELEQTEDAAQQRQLALSLYNYYRNNQVNQECLTTALYLYQNSQQQADIARILDAYKRLNKYENAIYFIDTLDLPEDIMKMEKASVYLAANDTSKARSQVRSVQVKKLCTPEELMRLARLQSAVGLQATSVKTLIRCFESSPEQALVRLKQETQHYEEFDEIRDAPEFKEALKTKSLADTAGYMPPCARKWGSAKIDETPAYIRNFKSKEINFSDWNIDSKKNPSLR